MKDPGDHVAAVANVSDGAARYSRAKRTSLMLGYGGLRVGWIAPG